MNVNDEEILYPKDFNLSLYVDFSKSIAISNTAPHDDIVKVQKKFEETINNSEAVATITRMIYDQSFTMNIVENAISRRPSGFRESNRENTIREDEYIYDIIELLNKLHSESVSEIDRYLLLKRYLKANYDNAKYFFRIITKTPYGRIKIDLVQKCIDNVNKINYKKMIYLSDDISKNINFANYFLIENPGKYKLNGHRIFFYFNCYGEITAFRENNLQCRCVWPIINDIAFSFKNNRIKNMVIEGFVYKRGKDGNEVDEHYGCDFRRDCTMKGDICFSMYDMYTSEEFFSGKCDKTYQERYKMLCDKMAEANKPTDKFKIAKVFQISSNDELYHRICSPYDCDGYIIMSPNKMDYTKIQEYRIIKQIVDLKVKDIKFEDGEPLVSFENYDNYYDCFFNGVHPTVKQFFMNNPDELINKTVSVAVYEYSSSKLEMPMLYLDQK